MKRLKLWGAITLVLLAISVVGLLTSCDKVKQACGEKPTKEYLDSAAVLKVISEIDNPQFVDEDDVVIYQQNEKEWRHMDSVFFSLDDKTLHNIVNVLIKRKIPLTKPAIVNEYMDNKNVYNNLPHDDVQAVVDLNKIDVPNLKTEDTVINGKHVQLIVSQDEK